jgi:hypothetical protein
VLAFAGPVGRLAPDPLAAGAAGDLIFVGVSLAAGALYVAIVVHSLMRPGES